jgi:hypothetical protein
MLYQVKDLSPEQKEAAEKLLGHSVSEDEAVSIKRIRASSILPSELSPEERTQALKKLDAYFAKVDAKRLPVSEEEEEAIITEALRFARPTYRPAH